jgi:glycosyltransferase involved in cell wall biosynthesis
MVTFSMDNSIIPISELPQSSEKYSGVIAVIPAYNLEPVIGTTVLKTKQEVDRVIVVDDSSTDRTAEVAHYAGAEVIRLKQNTGKAYALLLGLRHARDKGCNVAVAFDGDGRYDPREIPRITGSIHDGTADLVIGSRYLHASKKLLPYQKFDQVKLSSGDMITDSSSSFKAFSNRALDSLDFRTDWIRLDRDLIAHFDGINLIIKEVPVTYTVFATTANNDISVWNTPWKVLAAMPAFNEEKFIAKIILGAQPFVDKVLVIDDGSSDATREIALNLGALVVSHTPNKGYGAALRSIFEKAQELHVDALVILDSDGQHNPQDIQRLLNRLTEGDVDVVIGSRFMGEEKKDIPVYRVVGMKVLDSATKVAGVENITDTQSGFRAYGKKAIDVVNLTGEGMSAGSEILIQICDHNLKIAEVPISVRYDLEETSSQNPVRHGVSVLYNVIGLISYRKPLPAFGIPGFICVILGLITGSWAFAEYYTMSKFSFLLSMGCALFIILGLLLISVGLILNYLVMFMKEKK